VQPIGTGGDDEVVLFTKRHRGLERTASVTGAHFIRLYRRHGFADAEARDRFHRGG
jgi:protein-L-isoaspartate(D-aspartate) O-methyltransferase